MEKTHFDQAQLWFESAVHISSSDNGKKYAVAISMLAHSIIKANDALTAKFLGVTAKRHDEARHLFEGLIKKIVFLLNMHIILKLFKMPLM